MLNNIWTNDDGNKLFSLFFYHIVILGFRCNRKGFYEVTCKNFSPVAIHEEINGEGLRRKKGKKKW